MIHRYYRFAGLDLEIVLPGELASDREYRLEPFHGDPSADAHLFRFEKVEDLPPPEGKLVTAQPNILVFSHEEKKIRYIGTCGGRWEKAYIRAEHAGKEHAVLLRKDRVPGRIGSKVILESLAAEHLLAQNHGFLFHCSYIDHGGKAILFTAPSGTGKSTQADLWAKYRGAEIINGDRAAIRLVGDTLMVEGIPFAGSSQYCKNRSLPIEAIVYLGQAPVTTIRKLRGYEAFSKIWEGVSVNTWDPEDMDLVSGVVQKVAEQIPIYHMPCTPDEAAVIALEETLRKQGCL